MPRGKYIYQGAACGLSADDTLRQNPGVIYDMVAEHNRLEG